jgi:hypothetical protein
VGQGWAEHDQVEQGWVGRAGLQQGGLGDISMSQILYFPGNVAHDNGGRLTRLGGL